MYLAGYMVAGFVVAGCYVGRFAAAGRRGRYERIALAIPLTAATLAAPIQVARRRLGRRGRSAGNQPVKLAAFEGLGQTTRGAPVHILGWYDGRRGEDGIAIPDMLSLLAYHDPERRPLRGSTPCPRTIARPSTSCASPSRRWSGSARSCSRSRLVFCSSCWSAAGGCPSHALVLPRGRGGRAAVRRGADRRVGHDRGGPPAVGRVRRDAHLAGRDGSGGHPGRLRHPRCGVRRARRRRLVRAVRLARSPVETP